MNIQQPRIHWINYVCLLPFIALLGNALIADDWQTHTGIGKNIGFYIVIAFIPLATALSFWNNRQSVKFHVADYFILSWLIIAFGLSYLYFQAVNNKMATLVLLGILYYCFRIFLVQNQINLYMLMLALMLVGGIEALWGLLQLYGFTPARHALYTVSGSFFNPGPYAGFLAVILPVALFYLCSDKEAFAKHRQRGTVFFKIRWAVGLLTCIVILLILPTTMSRAAWMAATIGCAVVLGGYYRYFLKQKKEKRRTIGRKIGQAIVFLTIICVAVAGLYYLKKDSADGRTLIWKLSMQMASRTWFGEGLGRFSGGYGNEQKMYFESGRGTAREEWLAGEPEYAFNEFAQILAEQGYVPLVLFLFTIIFTFITGIRHRRFMAVGGLAALLVFALFSYPFSLMPFLIVFILFLTACISTRYIAIDLAKNPIALDVRIQWNTYAVIAVLLLGTMHSVQTIYNRYPVFKAHKTWGEAQLLYPAGMYQDVVEDYRVIYPFMRDQPHFLFEYGRSLYMTGTYEESIKVLFDGTVISADPMFRIMIGRNRQRQEKYSLAETHYRYAANQVPNRLYPNYLLAKLYDEMGEHKKAYDMAKVVVNKKVKINSPAVEEMKAEMRKRIEEYNKELEGNKELENRHVSIAQ
ncbi:O-antigen ligase family protein [Sphingobacterium gobiense]|uniref:O-antigen ligase-related domain-containing protein n=1 Tax=Sphingobacterium gobiense TaxID=1382456 RepID=A0A2S9JUF7_9SPHI|nr:O-antigen ligase family protein [Sphingobacterium gobiense]PRD56761.1 hypothetical protein C5749_05910 [Sphingobacterium gobiense]